MVRRRFVVRVLTVAAAGAALTWLTFGSLAGPSAASTPPAGLLKPTEGGLALADERMPALAPLTPAALQTCPNTVKWVREIKAWGFKEEDAKSSLQEQARKLLEPARGGIIVGEQPAEVCKKLTCADADGKKVACALDGVLIQDGPCEKKRVKGKLLKSGWEATFEVYWCTGTFYYGCFCEQQ